ncbi:MAG: AbrB/MazE/SpoVT family DNA-binding domain-containing protein [Candidatus Lokiarchaeota archaeon]|nr:AbrB/MazE/SpoVT family DNA-binding domain-containing protein [Candidatus Lokiarchaeota archaeon]
MVIKIDKQGRLVLPKELRDKYRLTQDAELVVTEVEGGIKLSPKKVKKSLRAIFDAAPSFDPEKALVIDVANYDENAGIDVDGDDAGTAEKDEDPDKP